MIQERGGTIAMILKGPNENKSIDKSCKPDQFSLERNLPTLLTHPPTDGLYSLFVTSLGVDVTLKTGEINSEYCEEILLFHVYSRAIATLIKAK